MIWVASQRQPTGCHKSDHSVGCTARFSREQRCQQTGRSSMSATNGHDREDRATTFTSSSAMRDGQAVVQVPTERVKEIVAALEVPFDPSQIEWRVMNITKNQQPARGQVVPYADQRAYTDRLNALFTPAGWTRKYAIHTSANFERSKDQRIAAKVLVTCELTIFGLGSHSAI